jgi:AcrR family transcriptional regulator
LFRRTKNREKRLTGGAERDSLFKRSFETNVRLTRSSVTATPKDTKEALLDAAETVFAEAGFQRASIRQIVARAGVNLAAVHYHFGSKEALLEAVFERGLGPVNQERLARLTAVETAAGDGPPALEAVLEAFLAPMLRPDMGHARRSARLRQLYGRLMAESGDKLRQVMHRQFAVILRRFGAAFQRANPHLSKTDCAWRMFFTIGAAVHTIMDPPGLRQLTRGLCDPTDTNATLEQLVQFVAAGFRSPGVTKGGEA